MHITPKRNEIYGCGHMCVAPSLFALVGGGGNLVGTIRHILPFNCTPDHSSMPIVEHLTAEAVSA